MNRTLYWYIEELSGTKQDRDCLNFMAIPFDPIDYAQQLEAAGVPKVQAEVHARTLTHLVGKCVALPAHLTELERNLTHEMKSLEARLRAEIKDCEARLELKIKEAETRLELKIKDIETRLELKIKEAETRLVLKIKDTETRLELMIKECESRLELKIASLKTEMRFMHWMNGITMALVIGLYLRPYL